MILDNWFPHPSPSFFKGSFPSWGVDMWGKQFLWGFCSYLSHKLQQSDLNSYCFQEGCLFSPFGYWGEWSPCQHNGLSCGVRWGHQTRTRVLSWKVPEELSSICPPSKESRRCRMRKRCLKGELVGRGRMKRGGGCGSSWTLLICYTLCTLCYKLESNPIRCCLVYDLSHPHAQFQCVLGSDSYCLGKQMHPFLQRLPRALSYYY